MLNQFKRLWGDSGQNDKDFAPQETQLRQALTELKRSADNLSKASTVLLDLLNGNR
jgi:hypothetical protein